MELRQRPGMCETSRRRPQEHEVSESAIIRRDQGIYNYPMGLAMLPGLLDVEGPDHEK